MRQSAEGRQFPNRDKKRSTKRKAIRVKKQAKAAYVARKRKASMGECRMRLLQEPDGGVVFGIQRGVLGHPVTSVVKVPVEALAGALEDGKELGTIAMKVGVVGLAHLIGYNLAYGVDGLGRALATWAGVDVAALEAAVRNEKLDELTRLTEELGGYTELQPESAEEQAPQSSPLPEQLEFPFDVSDTQDNA